MTTEEIQEEAWKEYIAYRKRNARMTLEEAAEIARDLGVEEEEEKDLSLKMGVFDSYEEPEDLEDLEDLE